MNVSLTPELEQFVSEKVKSGMYQTSSEVVREGLRLLKDRDERLITLKREIRVGMDEIERGEFTEYEVDQLHKLANDVKQRGLKRLAAEGRAAAKR